MDSNQDQGNKDTVEDRLNSYFTPTAEPEKQPEPTPSSEQTSEEPLAPQPEGAEVKTEAPQVDEEAEALANSKNPERTKSYIEKLKQELAEAKAQKATPENFGTSVFDYLEPKAQEPQVVVPQVQMPQVNMNQYPGLNPLQVENIKNQFIDQEGNVDINGLNNALSTASRNNQLLFEQMHATQEEVRRTNEKIVKYEETAQVREAHKEFPQLDPLKKDQFDPSFYKLVATELLEDKIKHKGGQTITLSDAAKKVAEYYQPKTVDSTKVAKAAVEEYKQTQQARNQGPFEQGKGEVRQAPVFDATRRHKFDDPQLDDRLANYFKK